jgi:hypothetical protein
MATITRIDVVAGIRSGDDSSGILTNGTALQFASSCCISRLFIAMARIIAARFLIRLRAERSYPIIWFTVGATKSDACDCRGVRQQTAIAKFQLIFSLPRMRLLAISYIPPIHRGDNYAATMPTLGWRRSRCHASAWPCGFSPPMSVNHVPGKLSCSRNFSAGAKPPASFRDVAPPLWRPIDQQSQTHCTTMPGRAWPSFVIRGWSPARSAAKQPQARRSQVLPGCAGTSRQS